MYILYYWYRQGEGEGGKGGPQASDCEGTGVSPRALAARNSPRLASPHLSSRVSPRLEKSSRPAITVTVTVADAVAVTVAVLRLRLLLRLCAFPGNIYSSTSPFPPRGRPAGF